MKKLYRIVNLFSYFAARVFMPTGVLYCIFLVTGLSEWADAFRLAAVCMAVMQTSSYLLGFQLYNIINSRQSGGEKTNNQGGHTDG